MKKIIETACTYDCPDACALLVENQGGEIRLRGHPDHPITAGFLCRKIHRLPERLRSEQRLRRPLLRDGAAFREIDWTEAFDRCARALERTLSFDARSIFHFPGCGSLGLKKLLVGHFFNTLGPVTTLRGGVCDETGVAAQVEDFGDCCAHDYTDLENASAVVLWGKNPLVTSVHLAPFIKRARRAGARVVLIDLWRTESAMLADEFIRVAPGGDGALAAAVLKLLLETSGPAATASRCENFLQTKELLARCSLKELLDAADVDQAQAESLASLYASPNPVATLMGWGMQRRANGALAVRWIDALCLLSGNVGRPGADANFSPNRKRGLRLELLRPATGPLLDAPFLASQLKGRKDPPIRFVWINGANPAAQFAAAGEVYRALQSVEFTVVVEAFLTDTARAARLVLPCTLMLEEDDDAVGSFGHHWVCRVHRALAPPAGVKDDVEIVAELARRLGWRDPLLEDPAAALRKLTEPWFQGRELLFCRNPAQPEVPFEKNFPRPGGRAQLVGVLPQKMLAEKDWPLRLLSHKVAGYEHSQRLVQEQAEPFTCFVNPLSAAGFAPGERAWLVTTAGRLPVRVHLRWDLHPKVCALEEGGWFTLERCSNSLVQEKAADLGWGTAFYDQPARLEKC